MKTIVLNRNSAGGIDVSFSEEQQSQPVQQVTMPYATASNGNWIVSMQMNQQHLFCKRKGCPTVAIRLEDLWELFVHAEPKLAPTPIITKQPSSADTVPHIESEIEFSVKWQHSSDNKSWVESTDFNQSGFYRYIATSVAGETISESFKK